MEGKISESENKKEQYNGIRKGGSVSGGNKKPPFASENVSSLSGISAARTLGTPGQFSSQGTAAMR